jgi:hypothetical protein
MTCLCRCLLSETRYTGLDIQIGIKRLENPDTAQYGKHGGAAEL